MATETIDPRLSYMDHPQCEENYFCRYSDAAFAELDEDEDLDLGKIAQPTDVEETEVDPEETTFSITRGAVSGWVTLSTTSVLLHRCSDRVEYRESD